MSMPFRARLVDGLYRLHEWYRRKTRVVPGAVNCCGLLLCLAPTLSFAADISIELPIDEVVVHPYSAVIERRGKTQLPAGEHRLIVSGLPQQLDPARLQLAIDNSAVRLGSLELKEVHQGDLTAQAEKELRDAIQTLQDQRKVISDRVDTANLQLNILGSLAKGSDAGMKPSINGSELATLMKTVSDNANQARDQIRQATIELRDLDRQIEQKQFELRQIATQRKASTQMIANIRVEQNLTATVTVSYPEQNVWWEWLYEARLDTDRKSLSYLRQVAVHQGSGDDWNNVKLTVTTANNQEETQTPELEPLFVDLFDNRIQRNRGLALEVPAPAPPMAQDAFAASSKEEVVVTGTMIRNAAAIIASQYLVDYDIPGRVTVLANRQAKVLPIDEKRFAINLVTRTVPEEETSAYLEARFTYEDDIPLQQGEVQLYRDGAFIGSGRSPVLLPGKDVSLPFGADERIRVVVHDEQEGSKQGGTFNRSSLQQTRKRFEITSYHSEPVAVEVLSRIPVSKNSKIDVEVPKEATAPSEKDIDGKSGLVMWKLQVQPKKTQEIKHYYDISYPKDSELDFEEGDYYEE